MTELETTKVLAVLKATYPNFYRDMPDDEIDGIIRIWTELFHDDEYPLVSAAVKALIASDEKGFPPVIGQVKARLRQLTQKDELSEQEAWGLVSQAVKNANYGSREEFDRLPPLLRRLVGSQNQLRQWAMMDTDTLQSVVASNFQRSYRARAEQARNLRALPEDLLKIARSFADRAALEPGREGP